jgi:peptidoglycan/LPS O-acetylase OafA/YrhL
MRRQIPVLRGLAILAVVCNHATGWGYTAMFWWTHDYRQVGSLSNYDQMGSLPYYGLVVIQQLAQFSVPAFLFISGFLIAYAARGNSPVLHWKVVRTRIVNLLWPYLLWSLAIFAGDWLQGTRYSLVEYLRRLAVGDATGAYFFVPLLCQFYLLAPFIARLGKTRGGLLIGISASIQVVVIGLLYLPLVGVNLPNALYTTAWVFVWHAVNFPLGAVCGFHYKRLKLWLARAKWSLLVATIVLGALSVVESEVLYQATLNYGWARGGLKFSSILYAVAFILLFLALDKVSIPFTYGINWIGSRSYGIYLLHPKALELVARVTYHVAPWMLTCQGLYQPMLVVSGLGIPILFMTGVVKSRARKFYPFLFG